MILPSLAALWRGAMVVLGIAAVLPASAGDVRAHPDPARSYGEGLARARIMVAEDSAIAAPGGESILLTHAGRTPRAVILFHGFTDSPRQFAALADSLFARGDNVLVPRLPHHAERGRDVGELAKLTAPELCHVADAAVDVAAGLGDSVVVVGLSVGGTLAVWAAEHRREVRRAFVIAPAFEMGHVPSMLERPILNLGSHIPNWTRRAATDSERPDRDPGFATHGLAQVLRLGMAVRRDAERYPPARAEVLFLVNANDRTVKTEPVLDLARRWNARSVPVSVYEFPDSLQLPHNVVDPMQGRANATIVYPTLEALAHGERPPHWVRRRE
ncbi:MAG TPA: alpha/beta hydrolase [Gemmatimonadaceae bacterium]|nr:alpha/beta hydrolase [Gemmatimonadaceae bacterium]